MNKIKLLAGILMTLAAVQITNAEDSFKVATVQGTVAGFEKEVLTIQPSDSQAKAVKVLAEKQKITAIYAVMGNERVLLSAVAQGIPRSGARPFGARLLKEQ